MPESHVKKWELDAEITRLENQIKQANREIGYLKKKVSKQDKSLARFKSRIDKRIEEQDKEREEGAKTSRNVILTALGSLVVGVLVALIRKGLSI